MSHSKLNIEIYFRNWRISLTFIVAVTCIHNIIMNCDMMGNSMCMCMHRCRYFRQILSQSIIRFLATSLVPITTVFLLTIHHWCSLSRCQHWMAPQQMKRQTARVYQTTMKFQGQTLHCCHWFWRWQRFC